MPANLFTVSAGVADDNIYYLSGTADPIGTTGDITFDAPIGSYFSNATSGVTFKKIAANGNAADWAAQASKAAVDAVQAEVDALEIATGQNGDGTFSGYTGTNYINGATSLKNADVVLDSAIKTVADAVAAETSRATAAEGVLTTNLASEVTRASAAEAALNTAISTEATARAAADTAEATARAAGDATLTTDLATEVSRATSAESALSTALAAEVTRAQAAEAAAVAAAQACCDATNTALAAEVAARQAADTAEATTRAAADTALTTALATEVSDRTAADSTETAARIAGDAANATALSTAVTNLTNADTTLQTNIDTEVTARTTADTNLQNQINALNSSGIAGLQAELDATQVSAGINGDGSWTAPVGTTYLGTATSLKDGEVKLDAAIKTVSDDLATEVTARGTADTAEATARAAADTALTAALTQEVTDRTASDTAEAAARVAGDAGLQTEVDAVETSVGLNPDGTFAGFAGSNYLGSATTIKAGIMALDTQVKTNTTDIATITAQFAGLDAALQAEIDRVETAAGVAPDGQMVPFTGTNYLDSVSTIRAGMVVLDSSLKTVSDNVTNEAARATSAEGALTTAIANEATARAAAVTAVSDELDVTQVGAGLNTDGTYSPNLLSTYIATATSLKNADTLLDAQIKANTDAITALTGGGGGSIGSLQAALDAEIARATAAEGAEVTARAAADTAEVTARQAGDATNAAAIAQEATDRAAADTVINSSITTLTTNLAAEVTRATAAEGVLTTAVADEATARAAADTAEVTARQAGDATNATAIAAETTRAKAAEAALGTSVSDEVTRATAAEGVLTTNLASEVSRAQAAETAIAGNLATEVSRAQDAEAALVAMDVSLASYVGKLAAALPQYNSTNYVATNDDLTVAVGKLDSALKTVASGGGTTEVASNVTTATVVDSVSTKGAGLVKWLVYVQAGSNKQAIEILASHNGDTIVDATSTSFTTYAKLRMGADIAGLTYSVTVSGTGINQKLNLVVTSGTSATVRTVRETVSLA